MIDDKTHTNRIQRERKENGLKTKKERKRERKKERETHIKKKPSVGFTRSDWLTLIDVISFLFLYSAHCLFTTP
jgi:50S ribosomal subunit-associated GTPase HflX